MRRSSVIVFVVVIMVLAAAAGIFVTQRASGDTGAFTLSGTIEATEIQLASQIGGRAQKVYVAEGDTVQKGQAVVDIYLAATHANEKIMSPIDGIILARQIEDDELTAPGSPLLTVANLDKLTLKVYVSEDRYGQIFLGQVYPVTVDSFPGQTFTGKVTNIASKAEFTPRNVQTIDSRQTTVYAIKLDLAPSGGKLKPGMPADVHFQTAH
jgi:multidrug efflux pump subunit AcrA (membrane-fusion protein)